MSKPTMDALNTQSLEDEYASALIASDAAFDAWQQAEDVANAGHGPRPVDLYSAWVDAANHIVDARQALVDAGREDVAIAVLMEHAAKANALDTEATALERIGSRQDATGA